MGAAYPTLFSPLAIGGREVPNRIVSTAHGEQRAADGLLDERMIDYYERRAAGGAGLMVTFGSAAVHAMSSTANAVALWDARNEPMLADMAARVHAHGTLLMAQATHRGTRDRPSGLDNPLQAPSPLPAYNKLGVLGAPHVLDEDEIAAIVAAYGEVTARLARCGWDGIEITALGTHLMEQFWSPTLNRREDRYGGDLSARMQFSMEVLGAVAEAAPRDFVVSFRISCDLFTDLLGLTEADMDAIVRVLDAHGRIDLFSISGGSGMSTATHAGVVPNDAFATSTYNAAARRIRDFVSVPTLVAGRILDARTAEAALAHGDCDLVAMTRALIADPDLPRLARDGQDDRVRPCIAINEGCRQVTMGKPLACSVNPAIADPSLAAFVPADEPGRVAVIGGGPSGMEAARTAALRGHEVSLYEREGRLGGQMHDYAAIVDHPHLLLHVEWLERELARLGVTVRLGEAIAPDGAVPDGAKAVILATGAESVLPLEAQGSGTRVLTDVEVAREPKGAFVGKTAMVYDFEGRWSGPSVACRIAEGGAARVELLIPHEAVCENLEPPNKPGLQRRLAEAGVVCTPHHLLIEALPGAWRIRDGWTDRDTEVPAPDLFVVCGYRTARAELAQAFRSRQSNMPVHMAGDCRAPRLLRNAVLEGVRAGARV